MLRLCLSSCCWLVAGLLCCNAQASGSENLAEHYARVHVRHRQRLTRPMLSAGAVVNVSIGLSDVHLDYDPKLRLSHVSGWLLVQWTDHRLGWKAVRNAHGVRKVRQTLVSDRCWKPSVQVLNSIKKRTNLIGNLTECVVSDDGKVLAVEPTSFDVLCSIKYELEEFGTNQRAFVCPITFGSLLTSRDLVDLWPMSETNFTTVDPPVILYQRAHMTFREVTVERKEIMRSYAPEPFATLEVRLVFAEEYPE